MLGKYTSRKGPADLGIYVHIYFSEVGGDKVIVINNYQNSVIKISSQKFIHSTYLLHCTIVL